MQMERKRLFAVACLLLVAAVTNAQLGKICAHI